MNGGWLASRRFHRQLVLVALVIILPVTIFNSLVRKRNRVKNAFSQIDVQLKRRYDLIPNLIEVARKYMEHERGTLDAVIQARNSAVASQGRAAINPSDAAAVHELAGAEGALRGAMSRFYAVAEAYPELRSNQNMMQLSEELTATENKVAFARQAYNDAVMMYNNSREVFPAVMFAGMLGFQAAEMFEAENLDHLKTPQVKF